MKLSTRLLPFALLLSGVAFGQAGVFVNATSAVGTSLTLTTSPIDTTVNGGANYCIVGVTNFYRPPTGFSDSSGNSYTVNPNTVHDSNNVYITIYESFISTTSATETFSTTSDSLSPSIAAICFHNYASTYAIATSNSANSTPLAVGSVTPPTNNMIPVSFFEHFVGTAATVASPMIVPPGGATGWSGAGNGTAVAYQIQTTASAVNPTFTAAGGSGGQAGITLLLYSQATPATFTITTSVLPECFSGVACTYTLPLDGGVRPYTCTLTSGTLPSGISLASTGGSTNNGYSGTHTGTVSATPLTFHCVDSTSPTPQTLNTSGSALTVANPLTLTTSGCSTPEIGTQGSALTAGCSLVAGGGTSPYTYSFNSDHTSGCLGLPEGISYSSGAFTSALIGGMGDYTPVCPIVTDSLAGTTTGPNMEWDIAGHSPTSIFSQPNNIFQGTDVSTVTQWPVDTAASAGALPIQNLTVYGGSGANAPQGFSGIPMIAVPSTQANVNVTQYNSGSPVTGYFPGQVGPIPSYQPVEGSNIFQPLNSTCSNAPGDIHVLTLKLDSSGNPSILFEQNPGSLVGPSGAWCNNFEGYWDMSNYDLPPATFGTTNAAGLPEAVEIYNYDWVMSANGQTAAGDLLIPDNYFNPYYKWPATSPEYAGVGFCENSSSTPITVHTQITDIPGNTNYAASCPSGTGTAAGELWRIKATVCASPPDARLTNFGTNPQAASIFRSHCKYGIRATDGASRFGIELTNDSRWNDADLAALTTIPSSAYEPVQTDPHAANPDLMSTYQTTGSTSSGSMSPGTAMNAGTKAQ